MSDYEEIPLSKFNSGVIQSIRIGKITDLINHAKSNPLAYNITLIDYNFNIWFRSVSSLYDEIDCYIKKDDSRSSLIKARKMIQDMMKNYPVLEDINRNGRIKQVVNNKNWEKIRDAIEFYELKVKDMGLKYQVTGALKQQAGRI